MPSELTKYQVEGLTKYQVEGSPSETRRLSDQSYSGQEPLSETAKAERVSDVREEQNWAYN